jgi:hypothetical protein
MTRRPFRKPGAGATLLLAGLALVSTTALGVDDRDALVHDLSSPDGTPQAVVHA